MPTLYHPNRHRHRRSLRRLRGLCRRRCPPHAPRLRRCRPTPCLKRGPKPKSLEETAAAAVVVVLDGRLLRPRHLPSCPAAVLLVLLLPIEWVLLQLMVPVLLLMVMTIVQLLL